MECIIACILETSTLCTLFIASSSSADMAVSVVHDPSTTSSRRLRMSSFGIFRRSANSLGTVSNIPAEILEGVLYCLRAPGIAQMFVLLTVVALCGRAYMELLPGFADGVFGRGVEGLGTMHAAAGVGAIIASVLLARRGTVIGLTRIVSWMVLVLGVTLPLFAATSHFWFAALCVGVTGFALTVVGVGEQQLLQNAVSGDLRGRVMSLYGMINRGGPAVGAFLMGAASEFVGLQWPVAVGGVLCLALCVWALRRSRDFAPALEGEPNFR